MQGQTSAPPLALDIDGTMTRPRSGPRERRIDPRVMDALREWPAPVVLATGKAFPYLVARCSFIGIPERVVTENGAVVFTNGQASCTDDPEAAHAVAETYEDEGHPIGFGETDLANRWRETEVGPRPADGGCRRPTVSCHHEGSPGSKTFPVDGEPGRDGSSRNDCGSARRP